MELSATNKTFITKGEFESNFWNTLTKEPKLNYWVNTILKRLVIQLDHLLVEVIKKLLKVYLFVLKF